MILQEGCIIQSTQNSKEDYFSQSIVYIIQHNHKGSVGFIINRQTKQSINSLHNSLKIYNGGPVSTHNFNILHTNPLIIGGAMHILNGIYWNSEVTESLLTTIDTKITNLKVINGYCGWNKNELEEEVYQGFWKVEFALPNQVFF